MKGQYLVNICVNKCVFSFFLKVGRLSLLAGSESSIGRLFQAVGQATAKALGPIVFRLQEGTKSLPESSRAQVRATRELGHRDAQPGKV